METYLVGIDAGQVICWIKEEMEAAPATLRVNGRRNQTLEYITQRLETHLGDDEREDLNEVETVATLEIAPAHAGEGWLLNVVVADELGLCLSAADTGATSAQTIESRHLLQGIHPLGPRLCECHR